MKSSKPKVDAAVRPAALRLLARREHSTLELGRKLVRAGYPREHVDAALGELAAERLLDDGRFAEVYVRSHASRGEGPVRIAHRLAEHGVSDEDAAASLAAFAGQWVGIAARVRHKRFGREAPADAKDRAKQTRFLSYRGFTAEQIRRALSIEGASTDCGDAG